MMRISVLRGKQVKFPGRIGAGGLGWREAIRRGAAGQPRLANRPMADPVPGIFSLSRLVPDGYRV